MAEIYTVHFDDYTPDILPTHQYGTDWPVVYIIDNNEEAYVGETLDVSVRTRQHLQNNDRRRLTEISIISNDDFNKSVILDLEGFLIRHMSADDRFRLQNGNNGLRQHNYYNRISYEDQFREVWDKLIDLNLAKQTLAEIENSDIYKYSPYTSLSTDQYLAMSQIIRSVSEAKDAYKPKNTTIVRGGPGTGKTVLAVHLMKLLASRDTEQLIDAEEDEVIASISENLKRLPRDMKIGLVIPMQSLRETLTKVFEHTNGLNSKMILKPNDIPSGPDYDLLIVDEAHRLRQRKALSQYPAFDKNNRLLGLGKDGTELDWIMMKSKCRVLFYDQLQSVKPADVDAGRFLTLQSDDSTNMLELKTQFRCQGGNDYITYIRSIFSSNPPKDKMTFPEYTVKLFSDCGAMTDAIKNLDMEFGLSRTVAGYAWPWISKSDKDAYDIMLDNRYYKWNTVSCDWVNHPGSVDEIGCIHTIQGYDLNYCAVIFGYEIDYDRTAKKITVNKNKYWDNLGKSVGTKDPEVLKEYVLNIYKTLMTRGIRGTYVYVCNEGLREYLKQYID